MLDYSLWNYHAWPGHRYRAIYFHHLGSAVVLPVDDLAGWHSQDNSTWLKLFSFEIIHANSTRKKCFKTSSRFYFSDNKRARNYNYFVNIESYRNHTCLKFTINKWSWYNFEDKMPSSHKFSHIPAFVWYYNRSSSHCSFL